MSTIHLFVRASYTTNAHINYNIDVILNTCFQLYFIPFSLTCDSISTRLVTDFTLRATNRHRIYSCLSFDFCVNLNHQNWMLPICFSPFKIHIDTVFFLDSRNYAHVSACFYATLPFFMLGWIAFVNFFAFKIQVYENRFRNVSNDITHCSNINLSDWYNRTTWIWTVSI